MKKIICFVSVLLFSIFTCLPNAYAVNYYDKVVVKTIFSEDIDLTNIESVEVFLEDSTEYSRNYLLEKDKNFELTIENVPVGPYNFRYGVVNNDEIGYYRVSATVNIDEGANMVEVLVNVLEQNNKQSTQALTQEEIDRISGSTTTSTTTKASSSGIIIEDDEEETKKNESKEESTTIPKDVEEARNQAKREEEKRKNRKKNSLIGKILFSLIGIVFICALSYAAIKISKANK